MWSDYRLTFRLLARSPGFVAVTVITLALGLGLNTAMFSIVNAVLFRGLPYPEEPNLRIVRLTDVEDGEGWTNFSWLDYADVRERQSVFSDFGAFRSGTANVSGGDSAPERFSGMWMTDATPAILGVAPAQGRWWRLDEDQPAADPVAVISDRIWQTRYGGRPDVLGQPVRVNGELATVIGVAPADFDFPGQVDVWMPQRTPRTEEARDNRYWRPIGRLKPGIGDDAVAQDFGTLVAGLAQDFPDTNAGIQASVANLRETFLGNRTRLLLAICSAAVFAVLLIACVNVANLLLARGGSREREVAVRAALGAGRGHVIRLLLIESLMLAGAGAAAGLGLAWLLLRWFDVAMRSSGDTPPAWLTWTMDGHVLLYVLGAVVFTCVAAGLVPALRLARPNLTDVLKDGARGSSGGRQGRFTRALVVVEVALSCVLLTASGLMIRTVTAARKLDLGYTVDGVMTGRVGLPETKYATDAERGEFYRRLAENMSRRPDVAAAGLSSRLPTYTGSSEVVIEAGADLPHPRAGGAAITPGWFDALEVKVIQGRDFDQRDTADSSPVAIVNALFASTYWPGQDPIGRRFKRADERTAAEKPWITVVGVVPTIYQGDFEEDSIPEIYRPQTQAPERFMSLYVRGTTADPARVAAAMREEVRSLDADLPIYWLRPLRAVLDEAGFFQKLFATMFGIFGGVALLMAGVGLYGVMAYSVAQRTQEIGVRMALGARPNHVIGMILRQGGWQLGLGLVIGLPLAYFASRVLSFMLFGVNPGDPVTLTATLLVLSAAGFVACLVPALRALRVSPIVALRSS